MEIQHPESLKPRKKPRQARANATVEAIFKASIQVLLDEGGQRLTTTRVAERAGVSVGTMYQYFPHKAALLYAVVQQYLEEFVEGFEAACLTHHGKPLVETAESLASAFVDIKTRRPDLSHALYRIASELDTEELRIGTSSRLQRAVTALLASVTDARFDLPSEVSFTLLTAMNGTTRAVFERGTQPARLQAMGVQLHALCRGYLQAAAQPLA